PVGMVIRLRPRKDVIAPAELPLGAIIQAYRQRRRSLAMMARNFVLPAVRTKRDQPQQRVERRWRIDVKEREKRTLPVSRGIAFIVIRETQFFAVAPARTVTFFR